MVSWTIFLYHCCWQGRNPVTRCVFIMVHNDHTKHDDMSGTNDSDLFSRHHPGDLQVYEVEIRMRRYLFHAAQQHPLKHAANKSCLNALNFQCLDWWRGMWSQWMIRRKSLTNVGNILGSVLYGVIITTDIAAWDDLGTGWRNFISNSVTDILLSHIDSNIRSPYP